jgi:hypothetical protein
MLSTLFINTHKHNKNSILKNSYQHHKNTFKQKNKLTNSAYPQVINNFENVFSWYIKLIFILLINNFLSYKLSPAYCIRLDRFYEKQYKSIDIKKGAEI